MKMKEDIMGIQCPKCSSMIPMNIPILLSGQSVICHNCKLILSIDVDASAPCLKIVEEYHKKMMNIHDSVR